MFSRFIRLDGEEKYAVGFEDDTVNQANGADDCRLELVDRDFPPRQQEQIEGQYHVPSNVNRQYGFRVPTIRCTQPDCGHAHHCLPAESYTIIGETVYCQDGACMFPAGDTLAASFASFDEFTWVIAPRLDCRILMFARVHFNEHHVVSRQVPPLSTSSTEDAAAGAQSARTSPSTASVSLPKTYADAARSPPLTDVQTPIRATRTTPPTTPLTKPMVVTNKDEEKLLALTKKMPCDRIGDRWFCRCKPCSKTEKEISAGGEKGFSSEKKLR
jgi:hypothetical protein